MPGRLERPLDPRLEDRLRAQGIDFLYTHQARAIEALRAGENVIVATPAASGKSLCYHLPVLEALLHDRTSRVLYVFPTKALAQDQHKAFSGLAPESSRLRHGIFDGDTPPHERAEVRRDSQVVITNPDMLHLGILPNPRSWYKLLRGLRYVVIDEAHVYRGVFGSHVANVIRRLRRLCRRFGNEPQFILCSATIANPGDHAQRLVGLPFEVVDEDGSPYGGKGVRLLDPADDRHGQGQPSQHQQRVGPDLRGALAQAGAKPRVRPDTQDGRAALRLRPRPTEELRPYRRSEGGPLPSQLPAGGPASGSNGTSTRAAC